MRADVDGNDPLKTWQARRTAAWMRFMVIPILLTLVVVLGRVGQLKLHPDERLMANAGTALSNRSELGLRGTILDRRGRVIALSTIGERLFVDPGSAADIDNLAVEIGRVLGINPVPLDRRIQPRLHTRYVRVIDELRPAQADAIRAARARGELVGVGIERCATRHYPGAAPSGPDAVVAPLAARLVGRVGFDQVGVTGLEHRLDARMQGASGRLTYLRDVGREPLWIEPGQYRPARHGRDVRLTIDLAIQEIAERNLAEAVEACNASGGRIVVVDSRTGGILAMYDLLRERPGGEVLTEDPWREHDAGLGRERCITDIFEPGSTFKPFVWAAATALGRAAPDEVLPTPAGPGYRTSYGRRLRDSHYHEDSTWRQVLVLSQNTGMSMVAERMTHREMQDVVRAFGFGRTTSCGVPGELPGMVTSPRNWNNYTQSSVSFGQEIAVTVVQMVRAFCAFARDGTLPALHVLANDDGAEIPFVQRVLPEWAARETRDGLREMVVLSRDRLIKSDHYKLFGKTGTAQLPNREAGGYHENRYISSFIGGAPYDDPRLVAMVVIDDPDRSIAHYGIQVAAPAVRDVMDEALSYLGVPEDGGDE